MIPPIASTRREQSAGLFREALRRFVWKRQGGGVAPTPPPLHRRKWRLKHRLWARVNIFLERSKRYTEVTSVEVLL